MEELIEKLENLKKSVYDTQEVQEYLQAKRALFSDKLLIDKLEMYHENFDIKLKKEIINSPSFLAYKEKETAVNLLILEINQEFRKIKGNYHCKE